MLITKDGLCEKKVRRRIAMGKAPMGGLTSIWKDRGETLETKVKLVKGLVFPMSSFVTRHLRVWPHAHLHIIISVTCSLFTWELVIVTVSIPYSIAGTNNHRVDLSLLVW